MAEKHTNARGSAHGGLLMTLADVADRLRDRLSSDPPLRLATITLSVDFAGAARIGDGVEARVDIQQTGRRLAFVNAYLHVRPECIVRASATFMVAN